MGEQEAQEETKADTIISSSSSSDSNYSDESKREIVNDNTNKSESLQSWNLKEDNEIEMKQLKFKDLTFVGKQMKRLIIQLILWGLIFVIYTIILIFQSIQNQLTLTLQTCFWIYKWIDDKLFKITVDYVSKTE